MNILKSLALLILLSIYGVSSYSQSQYRNLNKADKAFYNYDFKKSLKHYIKVLEVDTSAHVIRGVAQSYAYLQMPEKATKYFQLLASSPEPLPFDILEYAQSLKRIGDYDESLIWFEKYREIYPLDLRARNHSVNSYHYKKLARNQKNPLFFSLDINDDGSIMGFTPYEGGVIFSKSENNGSFDFMDSPEVFLDMLEANLTEDMEFEKIKYLSFNLNSDLHDGPSSYNEAEKILAFTRNAAFTKETQEKGSQLEILFSTKVDGKWQDPIPFKYNSTEHSVGHPAFSPDGKKLFFISNKPGGFGGTDVYVSEKLGTEWTEPKNLGPEVNTESDEMFPFVTAGDVVYFSTEGHAGLGGLDVFKTYPFEEFWAKPENLGAPVNSRSDDFSIAFIREGEALFCSDRIGGEGSDDAYYVNLQETKKFFTIPAKLIESKKVSPISVVDLNTGEEKFYKMGESSFLDLDVSETGYKVSWHHMGEPRNILISGKENDLGVLEIDFSGLDGLKPQDFLSQIEIMGSSSEETKHVRINQKVWTYESLPESGFFSEDLTNPPNYAKGKDNVIILQEDGKELRAEIYPKPINMNRKVVLYMAEEENETENFEQTLIKFCSTYYEKGEEHVSINLMKSEGCSATEMELFGEKVEKFIIEQGVSKEKIQLEWVDPSSETNGEDSASDHEIFITMDSKFALAE